MTLLDTALAAHDAGLCILPAAADGSKRPGVPSWTGYQTTRPTRDRLQGMLENAEGVGAVCGAVSGGLIMLELEGRALSMLGAIDTAAKATGLKPLLNRIVAGYTEQTPSGGVHWLMRCPDGALPNLKLARNATGEVLAETRGEGGWTILAPSSGRTHPTGKPWKLINGGIDTIATITATERDDLLDLIRTFDTYRPAEPILHRSSEVSAKPDPFRQPNHTERAASHGLTPGDDYAARTDWRQILEPHGWTHLFDMAGEGRWRRPGKDRGISATTGHSTDGVDRLYVFSSNAAPFEIERPYSKFAAYTTLNHGGDFTAAARALGAAGYGDKRENHNTAPRMLEVGAEPPTDLRRQVRLSSASGIEPMVAKWLWAQRVPLGSLALIAGREGIGKSTVGYDLAAHVTCGTLPGVYEGQPRSVIVAASEDSWAHTIVPRLMAAGANLARVFKVDVTTPEGLEVEISLPVDLDGLETLVVDNDVALILLDPLMSRLSGALDTHKDAEVRQALEPLVRLADRSGASVVGLIHVNKSVTNDPLTQIMGSRAFAAVARAVLFVMRDPEDDDTRFLGLVKCNVGPTNIPTRTFVIESAHATDTVDGPIWSSRIAWLEDDPRSIADIMATGEMPEKTKALIEEVATWLSRYLDDHGPTPKSAIVDEAECLGYKEPMVRKAASRIGVQSHGSGYPRVATWSREVQSDETRQSGTFTVGTSPRGDMAEVQSDETTANRTN